MSGHIIEAARRIRDGQWDDEAALYLMNSGAAPHVDLAALRLHPIRESALHALADLFAGQTSRAATVLDHVLDHQWPLDGTAWAGTFKVNAEDNEPPSGAVPYVHYDPNWRQFVGCTLAVIRNEFSGELPGQLIDRVSAAIDRCVLGEPPGRIPDWYTNPGLMAAWLGAGHTDPVVATEAGRRAERIVARFDRHGDVDEYNSPTYDGVDLLALGLWITYPPNPWFEEQGLRLANAMCRRISALYHPGLAAVAGPHTRAYGLDMQRYVSFLGMFLAAFGETDTLPAELDATTDHSHDLSFFPLVQHLATSLQPMFQADPVATQRRHDQAFTGTLASSLLTPNAAIGVERGRRHAASRNQYVPVTAHRRCDERVDSVGFFLAPITHVDAELNSDGVASGVVLCGDAQSQEARPCTLLLLSSEPPVVDDLTLSVGSISIDFTNPPVLDESDPVIGRHSLRVPHGTAFELRC